MNLLGVIPSLVAPVTDPIGTGRPGVVHTTLDSDLQIYCGRSVGPHSGRWT